jgi:hypothetical protein
LLGLEGLGAEDTTDSEGDEGKRVSGYFFQVPSDIANAYIGY